MAHPTACRTAASVRHAACCYQPASVATDPEDIRAGSAAGGDMYVEKPFDVECLLARVDGLLCRPPSSPPGRPWQVFDVVLDAEGRTASRNGQQLDLPPRELELLFALARRPGKVVTKPQLLAEVWGYGEYGPNVVERRISALRRRLEAHGPRLVQTVWGSGYCLRA